jgi:hypothetical protein
MTKLKIKTFSDDTRNEILSWSDEVEFIQGEGELLVDNGYVKVGQQVVLTSSGNVYKIEPDLVEDIKQLMLK